MATLQEKVAERYPDLVPLLQVPEVADLLAQAVSDEAPISPTMFQSQLRATNWYRSQSEEGRQLWVQSQLDPSTYWTRIYGASAELSALSHQMLGRALTPEEGIWISHSMLGQGLNPNSAMVKHWIASLVRPLDVLSGLGAAGAAKSQVETIGHRWFRDVGRDVDINWLAQAGIDVVAGRDSLESINARYQSQAWHMYPHLREQIEAGQTLADIFDPFRQVIAEELEYGSVEQVSMSDPTWRGMLHWGHPSEGQARLPTEGEIRQYARNRPQWWATTNGRKMDAEASSNLLRIFGARA
jgi:hypothetical protein